MASFTFRVSPSNPADWNKTQVRIDEKNMQMLGIKSGDAVKISGLRSSVAICLPLEPHPRESWFEIVYRDEKSKSVPPIELGNLVCGNIRGGNVGELVQVSRAEALRAERLVLGTVQSMFPYVREDLDLERLEGLVVNKGDRLDIPHRNSQKMTPFQVLDCTPFGEAHVIGKETKMELGEIAKEAMHMQIPHLDKLVNVIPVVGQIKVGDSTVTIPSIEIYDNGMRLIFYIHQKLQSDTQPFGIPMLRPNIKVLDDLGNSYMIASLEGQGGHGDMLGLSSTMHAILLPPLDLKARELTIVMQEMVWQKMRSPSWVGPADRTGKNPEKTHHMTRAESTIEIISGPWEFKVRLK